MEQLKNYLFELCSENAPSGTEERLTCLERLVRPYCDKCYRDSSGNLIAVRYSDRKGAEKIMIDAHIDEIGMVVTGVDDRGFVHFANHAGINPRTLPGSTVTVLGKTSLTGIVATLPPHLLKDADTEKVIKEKDMVIDIGFSGDKARELVRVGDYITLRSSCSDLKNNLVMGKSFDNRASAAALVELLTTLKNTRPFYDLYAVFSAGEEFGGYGARAAAFDICPDRAIVLDATFGISPYTNKSKGKELGKGPAVAICPILDKDMTEALTVLARSRGVPFQREVIAGRTGTNADSIVCSRNGVPTCLVSIPLRYMHSAGEVVSLDDIHNTARLVLSFVGHKGGSN